MCVSVYIKLWEGPFYRRLRPLLSQHPNRAPQASGQQLRFPNRTSIPQAQTPIPKSDLRTSGPNFDLWNQSSDLQLRFPPGHLTRAGYCATGFNTNQQNFPRTSPDKATSANLLSANKLLLCYSLFQRVLLANSQRLASLSENFASELMELMGRGSKQMEQLLRTSTSWQMAKIDSQIHSYSSYALAYSA